MFKEKLREMGLVTMEKEAVGDSIAPYSILGECKEPLFSEVQEGQHRKFQLNMRDNS